MGLQVQMAVHREVEAQTAQLHQELERMKVSPPTHISTLHNCTFIHHGTDVLSLDCCPIFTSLYRMSCIVIATIGIVVCLYCKQLGHE